MAINTVVMPTNSYTTRRDSPQDVPDHSTLARFRADHDAEFKDLFAQVLRLCADAGMVKVGVVSIDGTKVAANASRGSNRSSEWVREQAAKIAAEVVDDAAATDAAEDDTDDGDGGGLPPGFATRQGRAANIAKALAELERRDAAADDADVADRARAEQFLADVAEHGPTTRRLRGVDPVAFERARLVWIERVLGDLEGVPGPEANRRRHQFRTKRKRANKALVAAQQQADTGEVDLRGPAERARDTRAERARRRGAPVDPVNIVDPDSRLMTEGSGGGSIQGYNVQLAVTDDHVIVGTHISQHANDTDCFQPTLAAATAHTDTLDKTIGLVLADAGYFTHDNLTAPGPDRLIAPGKNSHVTTNARDNPTWDPPPIDATPVDQMRHRLRHPDNAERYKRRAATAEPVIGHLKDQTRLRRFARRGLQAVTAELDLAATAINLTRLHHRTTTT